MFIKTYRMKFVELYTQYLSKITAVCSHSVIRLCLISSISWQHKRSTTGIFRYHALTDSNSVRSIIFNWFLTHLHCFLPPILFRFELIWPDRHLQNKILLQNLKREKCVDFYVVTGGENMLCEKTTLGIKKCTINNSFTLQQSNQLCFSVWFNLIDV